MFLRRAKVYANDDGLLIVFRNSSLHHGGHHFPAESFCRSLGWIVFVSKVRNIVNLGKSGDELVWKRMSKDRKQKMLTF